MTQKATFAAGCFWKPQQLFDELKGVTKTTVGYTGGRTTNPTYKDICYSDTGHAEVTELEFDPDVVSFGALCDFFFNIHDPTQMNRQGPDHGDQYRSAIFTHSNEQADIAKDKIAALGANVVTEVTPAPDFWPAEEYHQHYINKRG
ncbi:MAG: peptide-methionine (S)-S-oxide reductase MsrA [Alphaproteobacteria bacterium]